MIFHIFIYVLFKFINGWIQKQKKDDRIVAECKLPHPINIYKPNCVQFKTC